jgi:hypothetical protein
VNGRSSLQSLVMAAPSGPVWRVGHQTLRLSAGQGCARLRQCTGQPAGVLTGGGPCCSSATAASTPRYPAPSPTWRQWPTSSMHTASPCTPSNSPLSPTPLPRAVPAPDHGQPLARIHRRCPLDCLLKSIARAHHPHLKGNPALASGRRASPGRRATIPLAPRTARTT